jgi:hypothetical protein
MPIIFALISAAKITALSIDLLDKSVPSVGNNNVLNIVTPIKLNNSTKVNPIGLAQSE